VTSDIISSVVNKDLIVKAKAKDLSSSTSSRTAVKMLSLPDLYFAK